MTLEHFKEQFAGQDRQKIIEAAYDWYALTNRLFADGQILRQMLKTLVTFSDHLTEVIIENGHQDKLDPQIVEAYKKSREEELLQREEIVNKAFEDYAAASIREDRKVKAKNSAYAGHVKNGTYEKKKAIQGIWASGKYSSRDICAEQECAGLGMSFSAARKALRNTPEPPSRS